MLNPDEAVDTLRGAYGNTAKTRTLHAKGRFYAGTFTATPDATSLCRAAHLTGATVPALVRFSNGAGNPRSRDKDQDVRGIAVSFRPEGSGATDLLAQTAPRFPVSTPEAFVEMTRAVATRKPHLLLAFLAKNPGALPALAANARAGAIKPRRSFTEPTYYAVHAYKWLDASGGSNWVRYTIHPQPTSPAAEPDRSDPDFLHADLLSRLADGPVGFTLRVQVAGSSDDPHDPRSVWKGARTFDAGTLSITGAAEDPEAEGKLVVFDPTRVIDGIELSDDPILRYRPLAYSASANRRV
jgi:catalase